MQLPDSKELESNKRDHKIEITDIAIEKVPMIRYKGIAEEHYEILQLLAKLVLEESRNNNDCNETAITYSYVTNMKIQIGTIDNFVTRFLENCIKIPLL